MSKRRVLFLLLLPLQAVVLISGLLSFSQSFLQFSVHAAMANFTSYRIELDDPYFNIFTGTLHTNTLQLYPEFGGPALVSASDLNGHVGLFDLYWQDLSYTSLFAADVQIYVAEQGVKDSPNPIEWLQYLAWLPQLLEISQLHFILAAGETWVFTLDDISGERNLNTSYRLSAKSRYGYQPVTVKLDLGTLLQKEALVGITLGADIRAPATGGWLELSGQLAGDKNSFSYDLAVNAHATNIERFLGNFKSGIDLDGTLNVEGKMVGDTDGISISEVSLVLDNLPDYHFEGGGIFRYEFSGESELDLTVSGELRSLERLVDWIDIDLSTLGAAQASANITGSLDEPVIQNLMLTTENDEGLLVNLSGALAIDIQGTGVEYQAEELLVDLRAPTLKSISEWLGPVSYDPGPWRLSATLHRNGNSVEIADISADAGIVDQLQLHVEGSIAKILDPETPGYAGIEGVDLAMRVVAPDLAKISRSLGMNIPDLPTVRGQWKLTGDGNILSIHDGIFNARDHQFHGQLSELRAQLRPDAEIVLGNLSARADIKLSDSSVLSRFVDREIPALGVVTLAGMLYQDNRFFRLDDLSAQLINPGGLELTAQGEIGNLAELEAVSLQSQFSGLDSHNFLSSVLEDFQHGSAMGVLNGSFNLSGGGGQWHLSSFSVASGDDFTGHISARGQLSDLLGTPTGTIETSVELDDPGLLVELTGLHMDTVRANVVIHTSSSDVKVVLNGSVGETELSATGLFAITDKSIAGIELSVHSPQVYLADFDLQSRENDSGTGYSPVEHISETVSPDFISRIIDKTPAYPMDIEIVLDKLNGESIDFEEVDVRFTSESGRYTLRKFTVNYGETAAEIRGILDINHTPPILSFGGEFLAADMNRIIADLGIDSDVKGTLSVRGGLITRGSSSEELVAALNGSFAVALEDAEVAGAAYDVLATDFLAWIYTGAATEESTKIDCARAKFQLLDGQASSDNLFLETRRIVASGEGKLDLLTNKLNLTLTPKSKRRIGQIPSSINLSGRMSDPDVYVSPISTYANVYSEYLLIVPNFFMRIFGIERPQSKETCLAALYR